MDNLCKSDIRTTSFKKSIRFINYELVEGDIVEFGVYTGRSLAILSYENDMYYKNENSINSSKKINRKIYGFDSFEGLQDNDGHSRWEINMFKKNHSVHPTIQINEDVTPENVKNFFKEMNLKEPIIIKDYFKNLNLNMINKIAICHIDCDLYESTRDSLELIKDKLVDGSILMFDDWFNNKANPNKSEQKAFNEFLDKNKYIKAIEYDVYATFCKSFIINIVKNN